MRLAYPQAILPREQSQPRLKDLNAGIWMRAVRRAIKRCHNSRRRQLKVVHRHSQFRGAEFDRLADVQGNNAGGGESLRPHSPLEFK